MTYLPSILIYGRDRSLLESRGWVLEKAGFRVVLALEFERVKKVAASQAIDLLLLCHSLPPEACEEVLGATASIRPGMRHLLMTANTVVAPSLAGEPSVSSFKGPLAMIAAVRMLIGTQDHAGHKAETSLPASH